MDIPVSDKKQAEKETEVKDTKAATVPPVEVTPEPMPEPMPETAVEEKGSPDKPAAPQGPQQVDINLGNVDVLMLRLLGEIRDEIRMLRQAVTVPRPVAPTQAAPETQQ